MAKKNYSNIITGVLAVLAIAVLFFVYMNSSLNYSALSQPSNFDVESYTGEWYAIQAIPTSFEEGCTCTTANYQLTAENELLVTNSCVDEESGEVVVVRGEATPKQPGDYTSLNLRFEGQPMGSFFAGDYNVIATDNLYSSALVGSENRNYLWILSRDRNISSSLEEQYLSIAEGNGFTTDRLEPVVQTNCEAIDNPQ